MRIGELFEVGPDGVGYIQDKSTAKVYGFYHANLVDDVPLEEFEKLNERLITFDLVCGVACNVKLLVSQPDSLNP